MSITFRTFATISDSFRDLFKRQQYEKLVLNVLNQSVKLIPNLPLIPEREQSHGQCDFKDQIGTKYDVKLLLDNKQGALIGDRKNDLLEWFKSMIDETTEYSESIRRRDLSFVSSTKLYKLMDERLKNVEPDEIAILFIPYPVVNDSQGSFFMRLSTDFLQAVYNKLAENNLILCKSVFFIYPSMTPNTVVLRNAQTRERDYINIPEMSDYIYYEMIPIVK